jgi:hypothetical protein
MRVYNVKKEQPGINVSIKKKTGAKWHAEMPLK